MGVSESSQVQGDGKVNSRPVRWRYDRDGRTQDRRLSWTESTTVSRDQQWHHIPALNLIAVLPVGAQVRDDYSILYTEENDAANGASAASPYMLKTLMATSLPNQFFHDFQPPGESCWRIRMDTDRARPNLHVVVSTGSGTGQAQDVWQKLVKPMFEHVCVLQDKDYTLHVTSSDTSVSELTRDVFLPSANEGAAQAIVLLSGDGGVVDLVNTLLSGEHTKQYRKPNIALLPLGTGNALAHSTGITFDKTMGVSTLLQGAPKELPLFCTSFSPGARLLVNEAREERELRTVNGVPIAHGAVVCSWGLHAGLVADSDTAEYRKFGAERFKMAAKEALFPEDGSPPHHYRGSISVLRPSSNTRDDWEPIQRDEHGYVLATMVSHLEQGFKISPASKPLDGKMRLVHFAPMSGKDAMDAMGGAYAGGTHIEDERIGYEEIEGLRIEFDEEDARWRRICVDGKIIRVEKGGWMEVRNGVKGVADLIVTQRYGEL